MDTSRLFTAALQLREPWKVGSVDFRDGDDGRQELHIGIGFEEGSRFRCPEPGCRQDGCPVHDTRGRVWRHLNFFQYKAFIHAGVPRVTCPEHGVGTVPVPWARPGRGFTLLFEAWAVEMARHLPVGTLAGQVDETDTRLWRSIARYVGEARDLEDYTGVEAIGIDETSRKGRHCITVVADLVEHDVINVTAGKDSSTVKRFVDDFTARNGVPGYVRLVTCDMSLGFRKGIRGYLPDAERIVDKFHVVKHANEAVDRVRKAEGRSQRAVEEDEVSVARERVRAERTAVGDQTRSHETAAEDRPGLPDARDHAGHPRDRSHAGRGVGAPAPPVLVDDALTTGTHEGPRPHDPQALERDPGLLRPPVHQRGTRGRRRRHPEHQTTSTRIPEHGLLRHHGLPDLRQARPHSSHRLTPPPTTNSE